jgi:ribose-phosphate pyrophosphokinase
VLLSGNADLPLATHIANLLKLPLATIATVPYPCSESRIVIHESLARKTVVLIQSMVKPVNESLMALLFMADAARRAYCKEVIAVVPYLAYSRQDKSHTVTHVPLSAKVIADLLKTVLINRVITIDLHSQQMEGYFSMPIVNVDPTPLFVDHIKKNNLIDPVIVSPDLGSGFRAKRLAKGLDTTDILVIDKETIFTDGKADDRLQQLKGRNCIIIDDIVDTGRSLSCVSEYLKTLGADQIYAYVTHPVLSNHAIDKIETSSIDKLIVTDTIPLTLRINQYNKIEALGSAPLLSNAIYAFL